MLLRLLFSWCRHRNVSRVWSDAQTGEQYQICWDCKRRVKPKVEFARNLPNQIILDKRAGCAIMDLHPQGVGHDLRTAVNQRR